jgi:hypothetical protein
MDIVVQNGREEKFVSVKAAAKKCACEEQSDMQLVLDVSDNSVSIWWFCPICSMTAKVGLD